MILRVMMRVVMGVILPPKLPPKSPREIILKMIRDNPKVTRKEMAEELGLSLDGVRYHLKKMAESDILIYEGTSRKGHWVIKKDGDLQ
jgi:ATP-dependent DNA helicase RecG